MVQTLTETDAAMQWVVRLDSQSAQRVVDCLLVAGVDVMGMMAASHTGRTTPRDDILLSVAHAVVLLGGGVDEFRRIMEGELCG